MRFLNYLFAALFLFGALVQVNDPDPAAWMAIYIAAGVVTFLANRRPADFVAPAIVGVIAIAWAVTLASDASVPIFGLFEEWEMENQAVEVSREYYGLGMIGLWMIVLTLRAISHRRSTRPVSLASR